MSSDEKFSLFETDIQHELIRSWTPLNTSKNNPGNCVPTALALIGGPRHIVQQMSYSVENSGTRFTETIHTLESLVHRSKFTARFINYEEIIPMLKPGKATLLELHEAYDKTLPNHTTVLAKDHDGAIIIFDGQTNKYYTNDCAKSYVNRYARTLVYGIKIKNKISIRDENLYSTVRKTVSPEHKKQDTFKTPQKQTLKKSPIRTHSSIQRPSSIIHFKESMNPDEDRWNHYKNTQTLKLSSRSKSSKKSLKPPSSVSSRLNSLRNAFTKKRK